MSDRNNIKNLELADFDLQKNVVLNCVSDVYGPGQAALAKVMGRMSQDKQMWYWFTKNIGECLRKELDL